MSMQSDIEILSIQAMEAFAKRNIGKYEICWEGLL